MLSRSRLPRTALPAAVLGMVLVAPTAGASSTDSADRTAKQSCDAGAVADAAKEATAVFIGTVREVARAEISPQVTAYVQTVAVDRVYKPGRGWVIDSAEVELVTQRTSGECSLGALAEGERYVVFADLSGETLMSAGDSGTALADPALVAEVEAVLGSGRPPVPAETPTATLTPVAGDAPTPFVRAALPGAALVLVGLGGLLVTRRLGRAH